MPDIADNQPTGSLPSPIENADKPATASRLSQLLAKRPDYSTWYTKQGAANALQVSTKQIERLAQDRKLHSARWKRPKGGQAIRVYHPADVERLVLEWNPPFVMQETDSAVAVANGTALQHTKEKLLPALTAAISQSSKAAGVRLVERLYLTLPEAAEYTGLGVGYLRRQIEAGKLELVKGAGPHRADVVRRSELEKL